MPFLMTTPFITTQDVEDMVGRDVSADDGAAIAVDAACEMVRTVCEQDFNRTVSTTYFDGTGTDVLLLPERPVNSAGTVLVDGTVVTDYVLGPSGMLFRRDATYPSWGAASPSLNWPLGRQNIRVTYDHGYTDVPTDVKMVALALAKRLVLQGPAMAETNGDVSVRYAVAETDFTNGERLILSRYRAVSS